MIDKVQKIRNEVERLQKELIQEREKGFGSDADDTCILELQNVLTYIDFLQKESEPQFKVGDTIRSKHWETAVHKIISMDDKSYCLDNGGKIDLSSQQLWELVKEPVNEEWVEELRTKLDSMSKEEFEQVWGKYKVEEIEEPISEELEEAIDGYTRKVLERTNCLIGNQPIGEEISKAVNFGAEWQAKKDQEIIETAIHHAYHNGRLEMKEQMTAEAIDGIARPDNNEIWCDLSTLNFKDGDKCKVVLIKED